MLCVSLNNMEGTNLKDFLIFCFEVKLPIKCGFEKTSLIYLSVTYLTGNLITRRTTYRRLIPCRRSVLKQRPPQDSSQSALCFSWTDSHSFTFIFYSFTLLSICMRSLTESSFGNVYDYLFAYHECSSIECPGPTFGTRLETFNASFLTQLITTRK